ncbi:T. brucei spp.-specific protein [Trypanosoma brucei gambiense DAL972]|uniref:T. brucei spp.-specific protein n=2 Tax=Trypanosoma brucei TaxID=5691 RepID=C9ZTP8_TRYB9|nr:T. brucei spp.-specific protein [Trypanosoma brucei gambiense DAL972]RHW71239.1 hypothetical protein DPX39_070068900 [Trypanosoma brucei equiperdum]CBH12783.1 T. brucei spp.-specific protein [Trypanosoma brucei gambiense DAL972]|eukprot:XP_011775063.1 T. brucei spp.-specific protein [Trypanosoma brucei gambiense DAL972]
MAYSDYNKQEASTETSHNDYYEQCYGDAAFDYHEEVGEAIAEEIRINMGRRNVKAYVVHNDDQYNVYRTQPERSHMRSTICMDHHIQAREEGTLPAVNHRLATDVLGRGAHRSLICRPLDRHGFQTAVSSPTCLILPNIGACNRSPTYPQNYQHNGRDNFMLPVITMRKR